MKTFRAWLTESPHETEGVVPVAVYFTKAPELSLDIPSIIAQVKSGALKTIEINVTVASIIPTQLTVSQPKVMGFAVRADVPALPTVMMAGSGFYLIDGHHRVCSAVVNGEATILVNCIQIQ